MTNNCFLGIDTSNYTTSCAVYDGENVVQSKKLLPVKKGELGLRQSDAVFHHTRQLKEVLEKVLPQNFKAIGVSNKPRNIEKSYMPCFLVGENTADILGSALGVPVYKFSHQQGHIAAALHSTSRMDLIDKDFIALHLSGGTSEILYVKNGVFGELEIISKTLDISAGQAIDRAGVMLGQDFPCGKSIDALSLLCDEKMAIKTAVKGLDFSLSGTENQCKKFLEQGKSAEYISKYLIEYIIKTLSVVIDKIIEQYGNLPIVFSGGVSSNTKIREAFSKKYGAFFASPEFSCDNAAGTAILASLMVDYDKS